MQRSSEQPLPCRFSLSGAAAAMFRSPMLGLLGRKWRCCGFVAKMATGHEAVGWKGKVGWGEEAK